VFLGGLLRGLLERSSTSEEQTTDRREKGILLGSGFVGGEGLLGVGIAAVAFIYGSKPEGIGTAWMGSELAVALGGAVAFTLFVAGFVWLVKRPHE